jgi:hypothetical protein
MATRGCAVQTSWVLTVEQVASFRNDGFVLIERALGETEITGMLDRLWAGLEKNGASRHDPATWTSRASVRLHAIRTADVPPGDNPAVRSALDEFFGAGGWKPPKNWGQALVTFPTEGPWKLPTGPWHLDYPYWFPPHEIWGMNMFLFIDDVVERGGGTLTVRSSHRLVEAFHREHNPSPKQKQAELTRRFRTRYPWFVDLATSQRGPGEEEARAARFMDVDTKVDGVSVRVTELLGSAGDVVLCHPWLVHTASPNVGTRPRLMRASRIFRRFPDKASDEDAAEPAGAEGLDLDATTTPPDRHRE